MRIALVNNSYQLGGAETIAQELLAGCHRAGHTARLYVGCGKVYPRIHDLCPLYPRLLSRLHHSRFNRTLERWWPRMEWTDRRFRRLADDGADLIHIHNFHNLYATVESLAYVAGRKPVLWTLHGHWGVTGGCEHPLQCTRYQHACGKCPQVGLWPIGAHDNTAPQLELKIRYLGNLAINVVCPARHMIARVRSSCVGRRWRVHHIPNGVSVDAFNPERKHDVQLRGRFGLDAGRIAILVVNRDFRDPHKGFAMIREALEAVANERFLQVLLVGDASDWAAEQLPPALLPRSLGYVSSRRELAEIFEASDVFLFASPAETFPCVILEAMAAACTIVATPSGGVIEQIEDGRTGVLAKEITGAALGHALLETLRTVAANRAFGLAAREHVATHFASDLMIRRYLTLYAGIAAEHATCESRS